MSKERPCTSVRHLASLTVLLVGLSSGSLLAAAQSGDLADGAYNPFGHLPIRVLIDASNLTPEDAGYASEARDALKFWEQGGNGALRWQPSFVESRDANASDVILWFRDTPHVDETCDNDEAALGCARPLDRPVPIEIVTRLGDGTFRSFQQIREISEHELGHALGLPHSPNPDDIMFGSVSLRAGNSWRPGDLARLAWGAGAVLLIIGGVGFVLVRVMRPEEQIGEVRRWEGERCPASPDGAHDLAEAQIDTPRGREAWDVCLRCHQGRPRP